MSAGSGTQVSASDGRRLVLGKLVKSGGAGSIYLLPTSPLQVAKIYHDSANRDEYERKVAAMLDLSPNLPDIVENGHCYVQIAWPQALLRDAGGRFLGFAMPAVDVQATSELECILQERQARAAGLPTGLGAKITLAANLAAVIAELHRQGHHVIDLKPVNLRFYPQSLYMAMLDCDGFGIQGKGERFAADQVTPDYLAPELHSGKLAAAGEEQQDRFALAVVVFQLLNFGIHPYSGRPLSDSVPTDIPGRIARRCYPYGTHAHRELAPSPVSGHKAMPADLRLLFDRAFESLGASRPTAGEWADTLKAYAQRSSQRLVACGRDAQHQHFAGMPCAACARAALLAATVSQGRAAQAASSPLHKPANMVKPAQPVLRAGIRIPHLRRFSTVPPVSTGNPAGWLTPLPTRPPVRQPGPMWPVKVLVTGFVLMFIAGPVWDWISSARTRLADAAQSPSTASVLPIDVRDTRQEARAVLHAAASGDVPAVQALMGRMHRSPGNAPAAAAGQADFRNYASHFELFDESARLAVESRLMTSLRSDPSDAETAFDVGWLSLLARHPFKASNAFAEALWANPELAKAWYGYGLASIDERETVGAFVLVDLMGQSAEMARQFPREMLYRAGIDAARVDQLQARARVILTPFNSGK